MVSRILGFGGQRFNRLLVLDCNPHADKSRKWRCLCDCGRETVALADNIMRGLTKGCGCRVKQGNFVHGMYGTREYRSWNMLVQRCTNPANDRWAQYGGRGIQVCQRWLEGFANFYADMGSRPPGTSIDRIDVDGNYEPGNCRWADAKTQARNTQRAAKRDIPQ